MSALPPKESSVKVVLAFMLVLVFCVAFLGSIWLANLYVVLGVVYAGGSVIFPLVRDLLGLPPRGTFERCLSIVRQLWGGLKRQDSGAPPASGRTTGSQAETGQRVAVTPRTAADQALEEPEADQAFDEPKVEQHQAAVRMDRIPRRQSHDAVVGRPPRKPRQRHGAPEFRDLGVLHQPVAGADRTVHKQQGRQIDEENRRAAEDAG